MTKPELAALTSGDRVVVTLHNPERTYYGRVEAKTDGDTRVIAGLAKNCDRTASRASSVPQLPAEFHRIKCAVRSLPAGATVPRK